MNTRINYVLVLLSIVFLAVFAIIAAISADVSSSYMTFDQSIINTFYGGSTPAATSFFLLITKFGSELIWVIGIGGGLYLLYKRSYTLFVVWVFAILGGNILKEALKEVFAFPRPIFENPLYTETSFSFPSGHAMMAMITYGLIAYLWMRNTPSRPRQWLILTVAVILIVLIGLSRLYLNIHYVRDVIGGYVMGGLWLSLSILALDLISARQSTVPPEKQYAENTPR